MNSSIFINNNNEAMLEFSFNATYHHIPLRSILYIESSKRKCIIHTKTDGSNTAGPTFSFYEKLSELSDRLSGYGFIRCHQSYLISICHASKYYNGCVYVGSSQISVSERYRKNIINLFDNNSSNRFMNTDSTSKTDAIGSYKYTPDSNNAITTGAIVCIDGEYKGAIIRIYPNINYEIGRDGNACEIVINLPYISRQHLSLTYRCDNTYDITDHSHNGTYLIHDDSRAEKLTTGKIRNIPSGSVICLGDRSLQYRLI